MSIIAIIPKKIDIIQHEHHANGIIWYSCNNNLLYVLFPSMELALCLQSVDVVDRQVTFTDTSTRISSLELALCLQSVDVVDRKATFTDTFTRVACQSTQLQTAATEPSPCYLSWWKYLWMWLVGLRQPQTKGTELRPCYLSQWKYLYKWLVGPHRYKLQPQSHHHATYPSGSTCESGLSVHDSHRLQPQSHHHATYYGGSTCKRGLVGAR